MKGKACFVLKNNPGVLFSNTGKREIEKKNAKLQEIAYKLYLSLYVTLSVDWIHTPHVSFLKNL